MKLIIGDKNLSTWSWRAWLALHSFNIPFVETVVLLDKPSTQKEILKYSPSGRIPCLIDGDLTIWDSLAILEYLNEKYPEKKMWPQEVKSRAWARSVVAEMHSGFAELRKAMPGNIAKRIMKDAADISADIQRIEQIWSECRSAHAASGPYLFGEWSIADCFYAPVVFRFQSYGVTLSGVAEEYRQMMLKHPSLIELERQALAEVKET
ncbi:glutathione S-transferase family protein [Bdellovibrio bacteriovorus]|uniref:glutathione S-transferase family protein n=1 Tax=Bdellovibrio bacteriovorus TaxID=959 RepID=UPI0035A70015